MITAEDLRKTYGDFAAVEGSSFEVETGEIFGVVGPNGAGKTTTLKMLSGLVEPTGGTVSVAGREPDDPEMRRRLGFLPEESPLYEDMTPRSYLRFFADLYDVPRPTADDRIEDTLDRLDLEYRDRRLGDVSKGMKRKVAIARSLVNDPDLLIYDEPASGLDPLTTNYVLEFTRDLAAAGKTVVFSAHNLFHVESVCDRVVIMNRGEIIARGTVPEIRETYGDTTYHVYTTVPVPGSTPDGDGGAAGVRTPDGDRSAAGANAADGDGHHAVADDMAAVESIREAAAERGGRVADIRTEEPSLEDIFLDLAGESPVDSPATEAGSEAETGAGGGPGARR